MYYFNNTTIQLFLEEIERLLSLEFPIDLSKPSKLPKTRSDVQKWKEDIQAFLEASILPGAEFFTNLADLNEYSIMDDFKIRATSNNVFDREVKTVQRMIDRQWSNLTAVKEHVMICDTLNGKDEPHIYSVQDKLDYVLSKLNVLASSKFYSVENILKINGVEVRDGECGEIAILLSKKGYVLKKEEYKDNDDYVRITVKGSAYIERKIKSGTKKSKDENLNAKLDQALLNLQKLGFGQEIIFEELEEMREQIGKLNKKNWAQLLKGKLVDLAVGQVLNKETAGEVFRYLTDQSLNLLK